MMRYYDLLTQYQQRQTTSTRHKIKYRHQQANHVYVIKSVTYPQQKLILQEECRSKDELKKGKFE